MRFQRRRVVEQKAPMLWDRTSWRQKLSVCFNTSWRRWGFPTKMAGVQREIHWNYSRTDTIYTFLCPVNIIQSFIVQKCLQQVHNRKMGQWEEPTQDLRVVSKLTPSYHMSHICGEAQIYPAIETLVPFPLLEVKGEAKTCFCLLMYSRLCFFLNRGRYHGKDLHKI